MKKKITLLLPVCWLFAASAWGQINFREGWHKADSLAPKDPFSWVEKTKVYQELPDQVTRIHAHQNFKANLEYADPVKSNSTISLAERIKIHEDYLNEAVANRDSMKHLYGALYLFADHFNAQDYVKLAHYALLAEKIAQESGNPGWQGAAKLRMGKLKVIVVQDWKAAIQQFEMAEKLCLAAKDSLCAGECLANIAVLYGQLGDFDQAYRYFNLAIPILKRFTNSNMGALYNNLSTVVGSQGRQAEAIKYLDTAITIAREKKDLRLEMIHLFNSALANTALGNDDKAMDILNNCIQVNTKNKWLDNLATNYSAMSELYAKKRVYKDAYTYLNKYYPLRDSINGEEIKIKIADLTAKYDSQQKELALQKSRADLRATQNRAALLIFSMLLLAAFGLWRWRAQTRQTTRELAQNQESLGDLTRILLEKNTLLTALEQQLSEQVPRNGISHDPEDFEENLYNQRILTHADWIAFKTYFEKAYPGYLLRLRTSFPALSEAEERLFLFIKLNLTTREAAAILGISAESVKKTRYRLRQRLEIGEEVELEVYIRAF